MLTATKPGKCRHCKKRLEILGQKIHADCFAPWWEANREKIAAQAVKAREKAKRAAAKQERAQTRARKAAIKTIPQLLKEAQVAFNAFIRERDRVAGHVCISSGRVLDWSGNGVDAGHYRSVGSASHLRFNEHNCHAQSKHDNQFRSGNAVDYRIGLIARIGLAAVEALEADNRVHKWTREELIAIRTTYRAKLKELKGTQ